MQLSDRCRALTGLLQSMAPGRNAAIVWHGIVPEPDLVRIAPRVKTRTRGYADRRVAIGVGEANTARGERVEVRRPDHRMIVATENSAAVLIGHDNKQVARSHVVSQRRIPGMAGSFGIN